VKSTETSKQGFINGKYHRSTEEQGIGGVRNRDSSRQKTKAEAQDRTGRRNLANKSTKSVHISFCWM